MTSFECKEVPIGPPKCTFVQVWQKALAAGAPKDAIAELGYRVPSKSKTPKWYFGIPGTSVSYVFDDDCM